MAEPESKTFRLRYTNSLEDLLAFQEYHIAHDADARRLLLRARMLGGAGVGALLAFATYTWTHQNTVAAAFIGILSLVLFALLLPILIRQKMKRQIKSMHEKGRAKKYVCEHNLILKGDLFQVTTPFEATDAEVSKISRVDLTDTLAFIRIGPLGGFIVPLGRIDEGDWEEFGTELNHRLSAQIATTLRASAT